VTPNRRLRLVRLRAIEHRVAAAALARADTALTNVTAIEVRVGHLRDGIATSPGETTGRVLQCLAEFAERLDGARDGLASSREAAGAERKARDEDRSAAHRSEELAERLHSSALSQEARARDLRTNAAYIWRKRSGSAS
jgi:hypothetical protein